MKGQFFFRFVSEKKRNGNLKKFENWESRIGRIDLCILGKGLLRRLAGSLMPSFNDSKDTIKEHYSTVLCAFPEE